MRPAVVALIIAPTIGFVKGLRWWVMAISAGVALAIWHWGISPIYLLAAGALLGIIFLAHRGKEVEQ